MDLKLFRKSCKLGQSEIAKLFGCSIGHISNIESGARSVTSLQIRLLIEAYGRDKVAPYADPGELPSENPSITVNMPNVRENNGQMNSGGNNTMNQSDPSVIGMVKQLIEQNAIKDGQISTLLQQQERLIALLEKK